MMDYDPLHPELYRWDRAFLTHEVQRAVSVDGWRNLVREVHPGLYTFRPFSEAWCTRLAEELRHRRDWSEQAGNRFQPPNSLHEYGFRLGPAGLEATMDGLLHDLLAPLGRVLFEEVGGADLTTQHSFLVEYGRQYDEDLSFHVDDSEVTLNLCLGGEFQGSELIFEGLRCAEHRQTPCHPDEWFEYDHEPGLALLHAGKLRHRVEYVRRGERLGLIVWGQSAAYREGSTGERHAETPWCPY